MDNNELLAPTRAAIEGTARRVADLVAAAPDLNMLAQRSEFSLQQVTAHLITVTGYFGEFAFGTPSWAASVDPAYIRAETDRRIADVPEDDPAKLSRLLSDATERFLDDTAALAGDDPATFHVGLPYHVAGVAGVLLGELLLHGYDMAGALGRPWPIDPVHAQLVLAAYAPLFSLTAHPERTRNLTVAVGVEVRGGAAMTIRFTDGVFGLDGPGGPVDATLSSDAVAFLLVASGRLSRYEALALGLWSVGGAQPEIAVGFPDLFVYP